MSIVEIDLNALADVVDEITAVINQEYENNPVEQSDLGDPVLAGENLKQFVAMVQHLDAQYHGNSDGKTHKVLPDKLKDLNELGDYGLGILETLSQWATLLEMEEVRVTLDELSIPIALWTARNIGSLRELRSVVDALSKIANQTQDTEFLSELSDIMDEIANAVASDIKQDNDTSNAGRPWRVLNLNHGIVATRTHDPQIMESVFEQILLRLPEDAANFFREGMEQMEAIGYPTHVRHVMEKYYEMTNNPTLH